MRSEYDQWVEHMQQRLDELPQDAGDSAVTIESYYMSEPLFADLQKSKRVADKRSLADLKEYLAEEVSSVISMDMDIELQN